MREPRVQCLDEKILKASQAANDDGILGMQCTNEFICPLNSVAKGESSILVGTNCQWKFYC